MSLLHPKGQKIPGFPVCFLVCFLFPFVLNLSTGSFTQHTLYLVLMKRWTMSSHPNSPSSSQSSCFQHLSSATGISLYLLSIAAPLWTVSSSNMCLGINGRMGCLAAQSLFLAEVLQHVAAVGFRQSSPLKLEAVRQQQVSNFNFKEFFFSLLPSITKPTHHIKLLFFFIFFWLQCCTCNLANVWLLLPSRQVMQALWINSDLRFLSCCGEKGKAKHTQKKNKPGNNNLKSRKNLRETFVKPHLAFLSY